MDHTINILHVDDDPDFAEMAAEFIQRQDERLDVETATSANEALAQLRENQVHCIVSDFDMPEQNGIEFLEAVREEYPDLPFILFTGKGSEEIASDAISAGVTDYLQKGSGSGRYAILVQRINNAVSATRAEQELQKTLSRVTDAIYTVDTDWRITYVNEGTEEVMGPRDELLGEKLWEQFPEAAEGAIWDKFHAAMETQEPKSFEVFYEPLDLWAEATAYPSETRLTVYFRDITDRKERERDLQETKSQLETAVIEKERQNQAFHSFHDIITDSSRTFDQQMHDVLSLGVDFLNLDIGIISNIDPPDYTVDHVLTPDGSIEQGDVLDFSDTYCELVYESDGPVAFPNPTEGGVEDHPCYQDLGLQAYLGMPLLVDGQRFGTLNFSSPSPRKEPFSDGERAFIRTISEWLTTELSRRNREQEIGQRAESLQEVYEIISKGEGSINEQIDALLAVARNHIGTDFSSFSYIDGDNYEFEAVNVAPGIDLEAGESTALVDLPVCERAYQTGQTLVIGDIAVEAPELSDPAWGIECYIGTPVKVGETPYGTFCFYDIKPKSGGFSDWERTFVELLGDWVGSAIHRQETHNQLQRQNERLEAFTSVVSHDLQNPLNVAFGRLDLANEECDSEHLIDVQQSLHRMETLIENLLELARHGESVGEREPITLTELVDTCWTNIETTGTLNTDMERTINAGKTRLRQVFENLFRNAVEHGGENVTVTVGELGDGFYIEDDGPGIPADEREELFEAGYSTSDEGTGFGLSIVKEIVEAHGWEIAVTEGTDGGARFEITGVEFVDV